MDCKKDANGKRCTCSNVTCGRRGLCCECLQAHLKKQQLPGCCFPPEVEKTFDRSFAAFAKAWKLSS